MKKEEIFLSEDDNPQARNFSLRLTTLRKERNVSACAMSYALGHNRNYINSIELQRHLPSLAEFFEICNFLHVSPGEFFSPQEDEECTFDTALKKSTEPLNLLFEEMTPEQSNSVFNMLNELLR